MARRPGVGEARARGNIETLPSGALRVRVYAGTDPVTKKRHNLIDTVPPGPKAWREAEKLRDRFLLEIAEKRNPSSRRGGAEDPPAAPGRARRRDGGDPA